MMNMMARRNRGVVVCAFALTAAAPAWVFASAAPMRGVRTRDVCILAFPDCRPCVTNTARSVTATSTRGSDSSDVVGAVARFHTALATGDSLGALALLAPDALVVESGTVETRAQYRADHLAADISYARAVTSTYTVVSLTVQGVAAWVTSTSVSQGQSGGRQVSGAGAELMVLRKGSAGWQIAAVHWSSRARRVGG
jgi:ketosteroid isomerase-like protein